MHTGESRITTGKQGESHACAELTRRGYAILATRYRTRFGEIDIVCDDAGTTVFVEVKARRSARKGSAAEAVSAYKQRRLAAMALDYLAWTGRLQQRARFDVVAIDGFGTDKEQTRVIQNAFVVDRTQ
jgi:putative endonuclease